MGLDGKPVRYGCYQLLLDKNGLPHQSADWFAMTGTGTLIPDPYPCRSSSLRNNLQTYSGVSPSGLYQNSVT